MNLKQQILFLLLALCSFSNRAGAQDIPSSSIDTIIVDGIVVGNDTLPIIFLAEVEVHARLPRHLVRRWAQMNRLRYNVYKVYPYAVTAADVLKDVDVNLERLPDKGARKAYLKTVEKELNRRFKGELQDLTIQQGQVLVKLIDRQTGKNCFSIIKEMKGGFSAVVWQGVALLFSNNLKKEYDPNGDDKDIETVVRELETRNYYQYRYQLQSHR